MLRSDRRRGRRRNKATPAEAALANWHASRDGRKSARTQLRTRAVLVRSAASGRAGENPEPVAAGSTASITTTSTPGATGGGAIWRSVRSDTQTNVEGRPAAARPLASVATSSRVAISAVASATIADLMARKCPGHARSPCKHRCCPRPSRLRHTGAHRLRRCGRLRNEWRRASRPSSPMRRRAAPVARQGRASPAPSLTGSWGGTSIPVSLIDENFADPTHGGRDNGQTGAHRFDDVIGQPFRVRAADVDVGGRQNGRDVGAFAEKTHPTSDAKLPAHCFQSRTVSVNVTADRK